MSKIIERLASFVADTQFSALPDEVIHEMKRVILDSIGCAIGGLSTDRGWIAVGLAKKLGGSSESTIIGTHDKASCTNVAFANGELINALDFDALSPTVVHVVPIVIPAVLALAETIGTSGKNLIAAVAVGLEIAARLRPVVADGGTNIIREGPDKGKLRRSAVSGFSVVSLAAAASAGKIMGLNNNKIANVIGIAGCICPPNIFAKFVNTAPVRITKYGPTGWGAQVGVTSALLAEMGYTGDTDLFDGEYDFWKYTGQDEWKTEDMTGLGIEWHGHQIKYKLYPCGGVLAGVLDGFIQIIEENNLCPNDIEEIIAQPLPIVQSRLWRENTLRTPDDYPFNLLYLLACAGFRINSCHWHDPEVRQAPRLKEFMQRVKFRIVIDERDFGLAKLEDPRTFQMRLEVGAKGRSFKAKVPYVKGAWEPKEFRLTDEELVKKFTDNASRVLIPNQANQIAQIVLGLENLKNVARLMEIVGP